MSPVSTSTIDPFYVPSHCQTQQPTILMGVFCFFYGLFPPAELLHVDSSCTCIYTCVQCGDNASPTTFKSGLADQITIRPRFVLSVFTCSLHFLCDISVD